MVYIIYQKFMDLSNLRATTAIGWFCPDSPPTIAFQPRGSLAGCKYRVRQHKKKTADWHDATNGGLKGLRVLGFSGCGPRPQYINTPNPPKRGTKLLFIHIVEGELPFL